MLSSLKPSHRALKPVALGVAALGLIVAAHGQTVILNQVSPPGILKEATQVGRVPASTMLSMSISLKPLNRAGLTAYGNRVSDRHSPDYHRFLSPAQIGERFGASLDTVNTTVAYLKSKGMTVTLVADNRMGILFRGRADKAEAAFTTKFYNYRDDNRQGPGRKKFFSFTTAPKLPTKIAAQTVAIGGIQNAYSPTTRSTITPAQTRQLYNAANLYNVSGRKGEGINIGITNFDGYLLSNLPLFYSTYNLAAPDGGVGSNVTKVSVNGLDGENASADGEGDLDIQLALAMAPRANLYIYDAGGTSDYVGDYVSALIKEANDNIADIISESYGFPTNESTRSSIVAAHDQHLAMTAQGITYCLATGDYGTDLLGNDYPDLDPDILQVGGTVATVDGLGNRITEVGWDGSGAGWSTFDIDFNVLPSWLKGTTVPTNINRRIFPDVSLHAFGGSGNAYFFVYGGAVSSVSGTSASSPTFAGQLAQVLQDLVESGSADIATNGRPRMGRITDAIYEMDGDPSVFFDVSGGDGGVLPDNNEAVGKIGWDYLTGWGAPNIEGLLAGLLVNTSLAVDDQASDTDIYTPSVPNLTLGVNPLGGIEDLVDADGTGFSVQSVRQNGVGQVAASEVSFDLTADADKRRSVGFKVVTSSPTGTTSFVYLWNYSTNAYDLMKTVTGGSNAKTVEMKSFDLTKYVGENSVKILVRSLKPAHLGPAPFRLTVDQAVVTERVARA